MVRTKDFGTPEYDNNIEPVTFSIYGETFTGVAQLQGRVLLEFSKLAGGDGEITDLSYLLTFFEDALENESWVRFDAMTRSKDKIISIELLSEIISFLIEEYSDRPEELPELS